MKCPAFFHKKKRFMTTKTKLLIGTIVLLTTFAAGRFSAPLSVKTVEVDKKQVVTDTDRDKHKETKVIETVKPDGTKTTLTTTTEDTSTNRKTKIMEENVKSKEILKPGVILTLDAMAGLDATDLKHPPVFGAHIGVNILGPIRLGIFGFSSGYGGVSVGLQF